MHDVAIQIDDPASPAVAKLIEQLDSYMGSLYPAESNHLLPIDALRQPNVTFLTACVNGRVVGCGAVVNHDGEYAEIKRMFVLPEFRGLKIGGRMLTELESVARDAGLALARLETGIHQPEAIGLYEKAGYCRREPYGNYFEDPLSVFMEKHLA